MTELKIIFLDIDGVLNSEDLAYNQHKGYGGHFEEDEPATLDNVIWGEEMVANLRRIVYETGASIVMSSTWRLHFSLDKFKEMFALYGWPDVPVIGTTPTATYRRSSNTTRGEQIEAWIKSRTEIIQYVIIDDVPQFLFSQQPYFVNTYFMQGLTAEDANKAIAILNSI